MTRYMRGLNEWLERDGHERRAEIRGVVARVDELGDALRDLQIESKLSYLSSR